MNIVAIYPFIVELVDLPTENHDFEEVNQRTKWAMFNSYVSLPVGMGKWLDM